MIFLRIVTSAFYLPRQKMLKFEGWEKSYKHEDLLWGAIKKLPKELTTELLYLELPTNFSLLWCKNIHALHKIPCLILKPHNTKTS